MPRNVFSENLETNLKLEEEMTVKPVLVDDLPRIKQMTRWLGKIRNEVHPSIQDVDDEISAWLANGYELFATHFIGADAATDTVGVLYILKRN